MEVGDAWSRLLPLTQHMRGFSELLRDWNLDLATVVKDPHQVGLLRVMPTLQLDLRVVVSVQIVASEADVGQPC